MRCEYHHDDDNRERGGFTNDIDDEQRPAIERSSSSDSDRTYYSDYRTHLPTYRIHHITSHHQPETENERRKSRERTTANTSPPEPQVFPHQGQAGQGPEVQPPHSPMDPSPYRKHDQVNNHSPLSPLPSSFPSSPPSPRSPRRDGWWKGRWDRRRGGGRIAFTACVRRRPNNC